NRACRSHRCRRFAFGRGVGGGGARDTQRCPQDRAPSTDTPPASFLRGLVHRGLHASSPRFDRRPVPKSEPLVFNGTSARTSAIDQPMHPPCLTAAAEKGVCVGTSFEKHSARGAEKA